MVVVLNPVQSQQYTADQYRAFQGAVGDTNPLHFDPAFAAATPFGKVIVPGFYLASHAELEIGMFDGRPDGKTGVLVQFLREIRARVEDQPGDDVVLSRENSKSIAQLIRMRGEESKPAINFRAHQIESVGDLVRVDFRNATEVTPEMLRAAYGRPLQQTPYGFAAAVIAPALFKYHPGTFGAYTEVTMIPQQPAPPNCTLIAETRWVEARDTRVGKHHHFEYRVRIPEPPHGMTDIIRGTAAVLELTATHK